MKIKYAVFIFVLVLATGYFLLNQNERPIIFMATTTTEDSGLLGVLIPELARSTGLDIKVVTFGTGKVLRSAMDGNADIILVHDEISELMFMADGYGKERLSIMQNDFVIVGPVSDPATIKNRSSATKAFESIISSKSPFVSRGDESGTHKAEMRIWQAGGLNPDQIGAENYVLTGAGMGRSLNIAVEKSAYILTDRATWLTFQNKGDLAILYENDLLLRNIYSVISVNGERHAHISPQNQQLILDWFGSQQSRNIIRNHKISGEPLFSPLP